MVTVFGAGKSWINARANLIDGTMDENLEKGEINRFQIKINTEVSTFELLSSLAIGFILASDLKSIHQQNKILSLLLSEHIDHAYIVKCEKFEFPMQ